MKSHWLLALALPILVACAGTPPARPTAWGEARQMMVVTSESWDAPHATLRRFERGPGQWRQVGEAQRVMLGRGGSAWGIGLHPAQAKGPRKREGDGRNPAGIFPLGHAFGYGEETPNGLPYRQMQTSHWCMDVDASPYYNRIVDSREVGEATVEGSTEPMRLDLARQGDQRYKLGFTIGHNPRNVPGQGSCIFAHLWRDPATPTSGCTAMPEPAMRALLAWLDPARHPVFVLMPEAEYRRREVDWGLPAMEIFR
ncbi:hypothetical protein EBB59_09530 [Lysobacter pythonis]|uniref:YkuD domain-containing protein n=1 Tax=Solilutibacter pythonis TaxID=2483112 RepID=A0A3M2HYE4_9GAMM|nr:hypothetical protein [Lysobacter pythonis]RMH90854.1 hypothetical protein EBB59_09530 [Lysobacter pythonis]